MWKSYYKTKKGVVMTIFIYKNESFLSFCLISVIWGFIFDHLFFFNFNLNVRVSCSPLNRYPLSYWILDFEPIVRSRFSRSYYITNRTFSLPTSSV